MRKGWEIKRLGELCDLMTGGTPSRSQPEYFVNGQFKWLVSGDIHRKEIFDCNGRITKKGMENSNAKLLPINSVLIALNGQGKTRGTVALLRAKATCNQSLVSISPKKGIPLLPEYIFCNLYGRYDEIRKITGDSGNDRRGLNMPIIRNLEIPLPPLPDQKSIISILDRAFSAIDKAKANTQKNLQNAKELFESYLQKMFDEKGEDWEEKKLGDVAYTNGRIGWKGLTAKEYKKTGPLFLSVHSLNYGDYVDFRDAFHISQARYDESPEIMLRKDDILICKDGAGIGKLGILPELPDITTINSSLLLIRCKEKIITKYLYYNLLSPIFQRIVQSRLMGATTPHLYQRDIVTFPILLPKLSEQKEIVHKLELLSAETKKIESSYQRKLDDLEELKKIILQKAFSGELTAADAGLYKIDSEVLSIAAEPEPVYLSNVSDELTEDEWLQLHFMLINIGFHNGKAEQKYLAEVKMEKSCHFGEKIIKQLQFNRNPFKAMNGPADFDRLYKLHDFAEANGIFTYDKNASYKKYIEGENFMKFFGKATLAFRPFIKEVEALLIRLLPLKTDTIDLYATTYTAWNNLLILKKEINIKSIAKEGRWHEKKNRFADNDFVEAVEFLKTNNLLPEGKGKLVGKKRINN